MTDDKDGIALTSIAHPGTDLNRDALEEIEIELPYVSVHEETLKALLDKAKKLVAILDDREKNHGALIGPETLTARNELALELHRWSK